LVPFPALLSLSQKSVAIKMLTLHNYKAPLKDMFSELHPLFSKNLSANIGHLISRLVEATGVVQRLAGRYPVRGGICLGNYLQEINDTWSNPCLYTTSTPCTFIFPPGKKKTRKRKRRWVVTMFPPLGLTFKSQEDSH
jgi:hypothetical protein